MSIFYVVSDRPGSGKTALCASMAILLRAQSKSVAVFKPVANGDPDPSIYAALLGVDTRDWHLNDPADPSAIADIARRLDANNDIVIVEASNSLTTEQSRSIADAMNARILVVAGYNASLSAGAVLAAGAPYGSMLAGYIINGITRYMGTETRSKLIPAIAAQASTRGARILGVIPEDRRLLGVSVAQLAAHLDGEFVSEEGDADGLVEYLMVGGLSLDPGEYYYSIHDNRAAIMRGDRPDLQMSALGAPGRTACLVATGGFVPIEYVRYEAELEETPIILVESDTLDTMAKLDALIDCSRFDHPRKLQRFTELLSDRLDLHPLLS